MAQIRQGDRRDRGSNKTWPSGRWRGGPPLVYVEKLSTSGAVVAEWDGEEWREGKGREGGKGVWGCQFKLSICLGSVRYGSG